MENKRFYRSTTSHVFGGVCGGLAEYFNIDPVLARVIFVLLALYGGGGIFIYIILWIVIPMKPIDYFANSNTAWSGGEPEQTRQPGSCPEVDNYPFKKEYGKGSLLAGLLLVTLGILFLIDRLVPGINFGDLWPVLLIVVGLVILAGSFTKKNKQENEL